MKTDRTYVAITDASIARLTVIELPDDFDASEDIENWLVENQDLDLSNSNWQVITSMDISITL